VREGPRHGGGGGANPGGCTRSPRPPAILLSKHGDDSGCEAARSASLAVWQLLCPSLEKEVLKGRSVAATAKTTPHGGGLALVAEGGQTLLEGAGPRPGAEGAGRACSRSERSADGSRRSAARKRGLSGLIVDLRIGARCRRSRACPHRGRTTWASYSKRQPARQVPRQREGTDQRSPVVRRPRWHALGATGSPPSPGVGPPSSRDYLRSKHGSNLKWPGPQGGPSTPDGQYRALCWQDWPLVPSTTKMA